MSHKFLTVVPGCCGKEGAKSADSQFWACVHTTHRDSRCPAVQAGATGASEHIGTLDAMAPVSLR
jgi:hypothetical protein